MQMDDNRRLFIFPNNCVPKEMYMMLTELSNSVSFDILYVFPPPQKNGYDDARKAKSVINLFT